MAIRTGNKFAIISHYNSPLDYLIDLLITCVPVSTASLLAFSKNIRRVHHCP